MKINVTTFDTKEQILDIAERLFAEKGFAGTTLRGVIREAGVNIAAVHYHFGSKEELFVAVTRRVAKQVVPAQIEQLGKFETQGLPPIAGVMQAFFAPPLRVIPQMGEAGIIRAQFIGRSYVEPAPLRQLAEREFDESHKRFLGILQRVLSDRTRIELEWKLNLAVAILIQTLNQIGKPGHLIAGDSPEEVEIAIARLVKFVTEGMKS